MAFQPFSRSGLNNGRFGLEWGMPYPVKDLTGRVFGLLTALRRSEGSVGGRARWDCVCACGNVTNARGGHLLSGSVSSCGCLRGDHLRKHGHSGSHVYRAWLRMKERCLPTKKKFAPDYAMRGITVCKRWSGRDGFVNFLADMGEPPTRRHTLDRIDNDGIYEPPNCRWATHTEQANNRRICRYYEFDGVKLTAPEIARRIGLKEATVRRRLRHGWPIEQIRLPLFSKFPVA